MTKPSLRLTVYGILSVDDIHVIPKISLCTAAPPTQATEDVTFCLSAWYVEDEMDQSTSLGSFDFFSASTKCRLKNISHCTRP